jgi:hypothetical protein
MRRGRYADGLRYTRRLLQLAPWNENAHRQALRQFDTCKQALWEELDVQPAGETTVLSEQIEAGELELPPQLPTFLTEEGQDTKLTGPSLSRASPN